MDDLNCQGEVVHKTLRELEFINRWLGGNHVTISAIKKLLENGHVSKQNEITIADLGCGGGDMLKLLARYGRQHGFQMKLIGIDANPHIINFAKINCEAYSEISFESIDVFSLEFQEQKFDIIIGTLFYHHFRDEKLIELFSSLRGKARLGLVVNDIHRHWFAYHSIRLLTKFISGSAMVRFDAPLSVLRAFTKNDWIMLLDASQIENYEIKWKWASSSDSTKRL